MGPRRSVARLFLAVVAVVAACSTPAPPTPPTPPTLTTDGLTRAATSNTRAGTSAAVPAAAGASSLLPTEQRDALAQAHLALVEGDYSTAADSFRRLQADGSLAPEAATDARFQLAFALSLDNRGNDALTELSTPPRTPDDREGFLKGLALEAAGRHPEAMQSLADYANANPPVAAAVWLEVAERELNARRPQQAADAAAHGLDTAGPTSEKQRLLVVRAQALAAVGDNPGAFDAHRQVLTLATSDATLGEQLFRLAQVSRDLGQHEAAVQALRTALDRFPSASTTPDALRLLDELGAADQIDPYILGRARYFATDYRNAVAAFEAYLKASPNGPDAPSARLYRALASLTPGNEPNALRDLDALADDPDQDSELAAQALLEAGQALDGLSQPDQAEQRYVRLLDRFPRLDAAAATSFRLGLDRYVRGADADALAAWDVLVARRDDLAPEDVSRALYWRAKALRRLGREADAQMSLHQAADVRPATYYGLRASSLSGPTSPAPTPAASNRAADEQQDLETFFRARNLDLRGAFESVASEPALQRARSEARLGLFREANWQADELLQRYPDRPDRLYALAREFADLDLGGGAARLGQAAYAAAGIQTPTQAPQALRRLAYPRPFANLTDAAADRYGLDPLLLDSTLRQASHFDAWAENPASGTRGLAAMSPVHADETALGLHAASSQTRALSASTAPTAVAAIEDQAWLLADRLRRYDGRPESALAAIATTERLADSWLARPGADDPDVMLESVDYEPVRASLRDILATRLTYGMTYPAGPPAPAAVASSGGSTDPSSSQALGQVDPLAAALPKPEPTAAWIKVARLSGDLPQSPPLSAADIANPDVPDAFARGAALARAGEYDGAIGLLQDAITNPDPEVATGARLRLGQALLAAGRASDALGPLQAADSPHPGGIAAFLLGRALATLNRCDEAAVAFDRFASGNPGPLAAQARVGEAGCLEANARPAEAVPLLEQAAQAQDVPRLQSLDLHERLALARLRAGDADGASAEYAALLAQARTNSYRSELNYDLGVVASDPAAATTYFRRAVQLDPRGRAARAALDELVARNDPAASSLDAADTRLEQNRYREALAAYSADQSTARAVYGRGVSLVRLGQDRRGIVVLESMVSQFPNSSAAADGLFRAGRIRESLADLDGAADDYRATIALANAGSRANDAQFRLAFVEFERGHLSDAVTGWRDLADRQTAPEERAQAQFWLGKALGASARADPGQAASLNEAARAAWSAAAAADPSGFYGLRAAEELAGQTDPRAAFDASLAAVQARAPEDSLAPLLTWAAQQSATQAEADSTPRDAAGGPITSTAGSVLQRVQSDPGLARADALLAMGLRQPAIWELEAVETRFASDPPALAVLGGLELRRGLYNTALSLGYDLASTANLSVTRGPAAVRRLAFPLPDPAALAAAAQALHTDPLLFSALMHQESNLDETAESAAQARGLSQLSAATAYDAARALALYAFTSSDLYVPTTNLRLGAFTFGQRLARYDQQIFPALAAYNAGTFAVDGWLLAAGDADIDTFAEAIPFTETYPYVQHIYENYRQYLDLYGALTSP